MTMRIELTFPRPLAREERTRVLLAISVLAAAKRIEFARNGYGATVSGEALSLTAVAAVLAESAIRCESMRSSLLEELASPSSNESLSPLGRGPSASR